MKTSGKFRLNLEKMSYYCELYFLKGEKNDRTDKGGF